MFENTGDEVGGGGGGLGDSSILHFFNEKFVALPFSLPGKYMAPLLSQKKPVTLPHSYPSIFSVKFCLVSLAM